MHFTIQPLLLLLLLSSLPPTLFTLSTPAPTPTPTLNSTSLTSTLTLPSPLHPHHYPTSLTRLAFGSCNHQLRPQPLYALIPTHHPSAFLHLGDTVYADHHPPYLPFIRWPSPSPSHLAATFRTQLTTSPPHYLALTSTTPLLATWDDHDYGENDGDRHTPHKADAQRLFLDFLGAAPEDVRRSREGVYTAYTWGPVGRRVKVVLLDLRYFQDPAPEVRDLLGEEQWRWLEEELDYSGVGEGEGRGCAHGEREGTEECVDGKRVRPDLLVIGSSIQFGALQWGWVHRRLGEGWRHFPRSRQRLLHLLHTSTLTCPLLFLSGDVHYAEIVRSDHCEEVPGGEGGVGREGVGQLSIVPIIDVTSSGLTHSIGRQVSIPLAQAVLPRLLGKPTDRGQHLGLGMDKLCTDLNFGLVDVDWVGKQVRVRVMGVGDEACMDVTFDWAELSPTRIGLDEAKALGWGAKAWQKEGVGGGGAGGGGRYPMASSGGEWAQRLGRCEFEAMEGGEQKLHVSGLKGLVSLVAGLALMLLVLLYFVLRVALEAVAWVLRRIGVKEVDPNKKRR